ncbi:hypothetical protein BU16DRAFT_523954 [Lophium mytilinum]|uniref:Uncharacterized protein n=1 Tax=Lophium mytilinum TaxID=390894 RepID=A0A6A6R6W7_9PEZI|nr:hypothetical protein BU16DRAFT_523954 [Lophium mytilinum]
MQPYANPGQQGGYQRPGSTTSFAGQPAPPPAYGAPQGFQSPTSPPVNQTQWAPPTQSPPPMQQWNQPPAQQAWGQNPQAPQQVPSQQQPAGGYNPGTYGAMPGGYTQSAQGAIPPQNQSQGNAPPPPPKPSQFQGGMQPPAQNSQNWNQQPAYNMQQPAQNFQAQAQPAQFNQQGQQGGYPGQQPQHSGIQGQPAPPQSYNTAAPPPPSATPGGSYFPPATNRPTSIYGSNPSGTYSTPQSAVIQTPPQTVLSPDEQHPTYIPPSLTGQGVQSYMPANTNPLPGVYVPPPPDIPAWSQAQHPPGQGGAKKFRYTKPNPQPQFQPGAPHGFQGGQQFQAQQPVPTQQGQQGFNQFQQPPQQLGQQVQSLPQGQQFGQQVQSPPQNQQYGQPIPQNQFQQNAQQFQQSAIQQPGQQFLPQGANAWNAHQSVGQGYVAQNVPQQPPIPAPYGNASQPAPQPNWQTQGHQQGGQDQSIQAPKPVHGQLQAQATQHLFNAHTEQSPPASHNDPVSPIHQKRNSVFGAGQGGGALGRTDSISSIMSRKPASYSSKTGTPVQRGPSPPAPAVAASALGMGGPSDWEHFGSPEDEIDDEEIFGAKGKEEPHHLDSVELPTAPSPPFAATGSAVSVDGWPTPPAPAPLNVNRPSSGFQHGVQSGREHYNPTPPPKAPDIPLPHGPNMHEAPAQKSPDTARSSHQWPVAQEASAHQHIETAPAQVIVMDGGGWVAPQQPSTKRPASPPAAVIVMDDGGWGQAPHAKPQGQKEPEGSFVMDDGGWGASQAISSSRAPDSQYAELQDKLAKVTTERDRLAEENSQLARVTAERDRLAQQNSQLDQVTEERDRLKQENSQLAQVTAERDRLAQENSRLAQVAEERDRLAQENSRLVQEKSHDEHPKQIQPPTARDLISDIDPWYAGSLERYVGMLRHESAAMAIGDKKKVFTEFLAAESEIRGIEYYRAPPAILSPLQSESDPVPKPLERKLTIPIPSESFSMEPAPEEYSPGGRPILRRKPTLTSNPSNVSTEQSFGMSSRPDERTPIREFQQGPPSPIKTTMDSAPRRIDSPGNRGYRPFSMAGGGSEPSNQSTTILTPTSSTGDEFSKAMQSPEQPVEPPQQLPPPQQQPQPQYKPYSPGDSIVSSATAAIQDRSMHRQSLSYTDHRQSMSFNVAPLQVSRNKGDEIFFNEPQQPEPSSKPSSRPLTSSSHDKSFSDHAIDVPAPLNPSGAPASASTTTSTPGPTPAPAPTTSSGLATLSSLLPKSLSPPSSHPAITNLQNLLSSHPSDFAFLTALTTTYESAATALRSSLDRERRVRQEESEARTDQLFNDNEISYADIGSLEDEFKAEEARRKAKEDREEYARFVEGVFDKGYEQLQEGVRGLMGGLGECEKLLETSVAGVEALEAREGAPPPTVMVIEMLGRFHEAVELRHGRITMLVAERDKRYKRTEIQPLYAAGNIAKMKSVERHFENAERQAVLRAKSERADRVADLVRDIEEAVVRSVGANQGFRDEIVAVLGKISPREVQAENGVEAVRLADQVLKALERSSKDLMTRFNEVELVLNGAVIEAEIAAAKAENLGAEKEKPTVAGLEKELKEGEERLKGELVRRLGVLEEDLREGEALIKQTLAGVGSQGGTPGAAPPLNEEAIKAARLKAALEEAKRRNGH